MIYFIPYNSQKNDHIPLLMCAIASNHLQESVHRPKGTPYYQWFFCSKGSGELIIDNKTSIVHAGQGFLIYADDPHSYKGLTDDFTLDSISFAGPCALEILRTCGMDKSGIYQILQQSIFKEYVSSAITLHNREDIVSQEEYSKLCFGFLVDLSKYIQKINPQHIEHENETINMVINYLEEHYREPITLDLLASKVNFTKSYLCALFKQEMHYSIMQYLLIIRIGWARLYLEQYPEMNVYDIGKMCGFESPSYFGKKFKEIVGTTPESYKYVKSIRITSRS